jgi:hypothetical protein
VACDVRLASMRLAATAFVGLLALPGCATASVIRGSGDYCAPPVTPATSIVPDPSLPGASREEQTARLLGLGSVFSGTARLPTDLEARLRVVERIDLARLTLAATLAELDCDARRARVAADDVNRAKGSRVQTLTFWSIAAAAVTGIGSAFLSTTNASNAVQDTAAIVGGGVTAGLGLASLYVDPTISFAHPRNLLTDVWAGPPSSATYPPFVWAYLTGAEFTNAQTGSIRANLVERWRHLEAIAGSRALLLGSGGTYDTDALRLRAAMLDDVRAEVSLANQDVSAVAEELLNAGSP